QGDAAAVAVVLVDRGVAQPPALAEARVLDPAAQPGVVLGVGEAGVGRHVGVGPPRRRRLVAREQRALRRPGADHGQRRLGGFLRARGLRGGGRRAGEGRRRGGRRRVVGGGGEQY